jgi:hypothetical protein
VGIKFQIPGNPVRHDSLVSSVIKIFEKELLAEGINALKSLKCVDLVDGITLLDDVMNVVANHSGSILLASTILKSDFFMNLQKMSLPE